MLNWHACFPAHPRSQVIRLASSIQTSFELSDPLNRLHELSTIQQMAAYVDSVVAQGGGARLVAREWTPGQPLPASFGQQQVGGWWWPQKRSALCVSVPLYVEHQPL